MNRVICDVCGTKYPETSEQCPICGCAKSEKTKIISVESGVSDGDSTASYTHVKGGRFSKANVRRRNRMAADSHKPESDLYMEDTAREKDTNKGLVIAVVALLLAIVAVMLFIFFKYFAPAGMKDGTNDTTAAVETTTVPVTTETDPIEALEYPCTGIELSANSVNFDKIGDTWLLSVEITPVECTDILTFASNDPGIAEVNDEGRITAIAVGETVISVTCGDITESCTVYISDASATTEPSTEATEAVVEAEWKLNRNDFTLAKQGDTWMLYKGDVDVEDITWTSDNPAVATFEKGVVTAVGPGTTQVHAEYNGTKYSCYVHCKFTVPSENETTDPTENEATDATQSTETQGNYSLYIYNGKVNGEEGRLGDATIKIGETFPLTLRNDNGDIISVSWTVENDKICSITNNTVKGLSKGETVITVEHNGITYKCIVRVK